MKKKGNFLWIAVQAILLTALTLGLVSAFRAVSESGQALAPYSPTCVPTPILWSTDTGTPTITPAPSQQVPPSFSASVTPLPISKITDLSPDVPKEDKGQVVVFHCDGTFELFLTFAGTPAPLLPGDVIVLSAPPDSLMGKTVPQGTAVELPTVTPEGTIIFPPITPPGTPTGWPQPTLIATSTPFTETPLPLPTPAEDAAGFITYVARESLDGASAVYSIIVDASGTPVAAPVLISGDVQISGNVYPSPDGKRLLFGGGWDGLSVIYPDTGQVQPLFRQNLDPQGLFLDWHPNSRQVLIRAQQNYTDVGLWLVDVDTGEHITLFVQYPSPNIDGGSVSPDGQKAVFVFQAGGIVTHYEMWVVNSDGSNPQLIFTAPTLLAPLWSPDGTKIAFAAGSGLMTINADGSNPRTVSQNSLTDSYLPSFVWSPDSKKLAIIAPEGDSVSHPSLWSTGDLTGATIHLVDVETGNEGPLLTDGVTGNIDPTWSPDGSQIAFISNRSGATEIWAVNTDGTNFRQLTYVGQPVRFLYWHRP